MNTPHDQLFRGILDDVGARFVYAVTTQAVQTAVLRHECDPLAAHVLGRALTSGVLVTPLLNEDESYTLRWQYNGALRTVLVDARADGSVRGLVSPTDLVDRVDTEAEIYGSEGTTTTIRANSSRTLNSGTAQAALFDVVDDLAFHISYSNQVETAICALIAFRPDPQQPVRLAQGVLLQAMPDCDLEVFDGVRQRMQAPAFRDLLGVAPEADNHFERLARCLLDGQERPGAYTMHAGPRPAFRCRCSPDHLLPLVRSLPDEDVEDLLAKDEEVRVTCHFCSRVHVIPVCELRAELAAARGTDAEDQGGMAGE